jgi:hypothetical protein
MMMARFQRHAAPFCLSTLPSIANTECRGSAQVTATCGCPGHDPVWLEDHPRVTSTLAYSKLQYMVTAYAFDDSVAAPLAAEATKSFRSQMPPKLEG